MNINEDLKFMPLGVKVYEILRDKILTGEIENGTSLVENKLSSEYGVSRTPIRDAVLRLEREGLVKTEPNRGAVVVSLSDDDILDIYLMRQRLEGIAAKRAAKNISEKKLLELKECTDLFEFHASKGNISSFYSLDSKFHLIIFEASKSRPIEATLKNLHSYSKKASAKTLGFEKRLENVIKEHKAIFEAIKKGDEELAAKLMCGHIGNALECYKKAVKKA